MLLARQILRPLTQLAHSSQRIASGHYDERMPVGGSDELAQMATSFNQMAEALDQVEQTRVTLIGDVSHELRTPLTSLSGYLEGMMDGVFPDTEETLGLMYGEVRRLRRLVDDLQTLSRVEAGQISLHMGTFDLRALAQRAVSKLQPQWQMQDIRVQVEGPENQVLAYADPDRVDQILLNLLGNALANTPDGGEIWVRLGEDGRFARVEVQDNGAGIPAEQLPLLFERFFRADRSRSSGGSGIGLTISRHLVWAMGGELSAHSEGPGSGSTFSFTLPLARGGQQPV
jgi:histidine kinase